MFWKILYMSSPEDIEAVVHKLVKEYLSKKIFSSMEGLVIFINNRTRRNQNINRARIELILKSMIKRRIIVPGTKLMKNTVIENETRNHILNYVKKNPGKNINEIMRAHKLGSNLTLWHLSALEKFQLIRSKTIGNRKIFFNYNADSKYDEYHYYLHNNVVLTIIKFMTKKNHSLKVTQIAEGLGKNHNTIKKYLKVLQQLKLVKVEKDQTRNVYRINKEKYSKIIRIMKVK
ncbi:MAG: hypothetical protein ACTSR8_14600 [Promethearchaeota archaeon]